MATEKQKVLGLDAVEQIKTYVCFACENTKRDVEIIMDREHDKLKNELIDYTTEEVSKRAALTDSDGCINGYTVKTMIGIEVDDPNLDKDAAWELNKAGNGQLSKTHIGWERNGSGYIGKKITNDYVFEGLPDNAFDKTIYWDENGIISFGKDVRPWDADYRDAKDYAYELFQRLLAMLEDLKGEVKPEDPIYIKLDNMMTKLNIHKIK